MSDWIEKHLAQGHEILVTMVARRTSTYWLTAMETTTNKTVEQIKVSAGFLKSIEAIYRWQENGWLTKRRCPNTAATAKSNAKWGSWQ